MRNYEAVLIFKPEGELLAQGREFVRGLFNDNGCKVVNEEEMGERALAYEIKKNNRGFYVLYEFESEPENIQAFDKALKLRGEILKYLFIRK
ncbi:MAG: 30S ribosomal protein S6 [Spirochaetales bacterium]|nr:30S ribosomal protein S6 [Spirochaetales bacterium]